ncbi:MAG: neutral zinc metallopeptidase [Acidimicrobiales bacterium]|nr:neutral zinc metallopeptidase [Acidimicrobiales bacterium]
MVKIRRGARVRDVEYRGRARSGGTRGALPFPMPTSRGGKAGAGAGGIGVIGLVIVIVISMLGNSADTSGDVAEENRFLGAVFTDVQDYWESTLADYRRATMVIFLDHVETGGCGFATAATGPFYCPADEHVYLDQSFFDILAGPQFGAPGDFAQAYVIAHEVAHHVQTVVGTSGQVRTAQAQASSQSEANALTIRLELQADCLAGTWASVASRRPASATVTLEPGDIAEGLAAAEAVGDDRIQESAGQDVTPHNWTHGSAEQRQAWFTLGLETGDPVRCEETFDMSVDATRVMPG